MVSFEHRSVAHRILPSIALTWAMVVLGVSLSACSSSRNNDEDDVTSCFDEKSRPKPVVKTAAVVAPKPDASVAPKPDASAAPKPDASVAPKPDASVAPKPDASKAAKPPTSTFGSDREAVEAFYKELTIK